MNTKPVKIGSVRHIDHTVDVLMDETHLIIEVTNHLADGDTQVLLCRLPVATQANSLKKKSARLQGNQSTPARADRRRPWAR